MVFSLLIQLVFLATFIRLGWKCFEVSKSATLYGSMISKRREPKCCLGQVFNFKLGSFTMKQFQLHYMHTDNSVVENSAQVLSCLLKSVHALSREDKLKGNDFLVQTSWDQLLLKLKTLFSFLLNQLPNEEVNCTEPSPSVSVPCFICQNFDGGKKKEWAQKGWKKVFITLRPEGPNQRPVWTRLSRRCPWQCRCQPSWGPESRWRRHPSRPRWPPSSGKPLQWSASAAATSWAPML